ncbi:MAG TPA: hypothetical protein VFI28_10820 [Candidatus Limnocylindrales bacterium]|nr:hypothetical protein [Candidatus Limnocylindrales bacterium]
MTGDGGTTADRTAALGGDRSVPVPDPIARDYLLLALRLGQRIDGLVDGYFGPADVKAQADMEQLRPPARLVADAVELRGRAAGEVGEPDRRDWLARQLVALETHARALAGERLGYVEELGRLFDWTPERRDEARFDEAARELDELLPGRGTVAERLAAWDAGLVVAEDRLPAVVSWLVERDRVRAASLFGLPAGESFRAAFVRDRPWSGYNWYEGGRRSRFDLNLDLPIRAPSLVQVVAHETYPGHHLEHAWKEADLVDTLGRLEASILLINTPECLISEGLADLGVRFAVPRGEEAELLAELFDRAGIAAGQPAPAVRSLAERVVRIRPARERLDEVAINAALLRHADGRSHAEVLDYLVRVGRIEPTRAAKRLEFVEHPLWRSYVFVYAEGRELLRRWLDAVPAEAQAGRFGRLFHEQLTPSAIAAEIIAAGSDPDPGAAVVPVGVSAPTTTPRASRS